MNINRKELINGLNRINNINSQIVKLSITDEKLTMKTYNNFSKIQYEMDLPKKYENFDICVNSKIFNNIISKTNVEEIVLEKEGDSLEISFENSKFTLNTLSEENFKNFNFIIKQNFQKIPLSLDDLIRINKFILPYCVDEQNDVSKKLSSINCINLISENSDLINVYATDGKRLSNLKIPVKFNERINFLIYSKTFSQVLKCLNSKSLSLLYNEKKIFFVETNLKIEIDLMSFSFPDVNKLAEDKKNNFIKLNVSQLINKLERGNIISYNVLNSVVYFSFEQKQAILSFRNSENGYATEMISYELLHGEMPNFSININYLLTALKNIADSEVYFSINDNLSPLFIYDNKDENLLQVILPTKNIF